MVARGDSITAARLYTLQNLYMTRARVLTRTVDRHGTPARPTNFHSHTSSSWPNGPFAPSRGCCAVPRSAPALPRDAVHCQRARGSSPRTSQSLRPTLQTSARVLVVRIACERLERGGGQWSRRARHAALTIRARQGRQQDALRCATSARHRAAGRGGESSAQPSVCRGRAAGEHSYLVATPIDTGSSATGAADTLRRATKAVLG